MQNDPYLHRHHVLWSLVGALALFNAVIWSAVFPTPHDFLQKIGFESSASVRIGALLKEYEGSTTLAVAERNHDCVIRGSLPDPACTPGAIFPDATPAEICVPGYTKRVRSVSQSLKKFVYGAYSIPYPQPTGSYELDHLIPLALGGSNDAANLFPEAKDPQPGFKEKDVVEVYLYEQMCAGKVPLKEAQVLIAHDWVKVYQALDASVVSNLKAKYRSWSN